MPRLYIASEDQIKSGLVTDVYFERAKETLRRFGLDRHVSMEAHAYSLPKGYGWAVLAGIEEVAYILEGKPIDVYSMDEGTIFKAMEPIIRIEGSYTSFSEVESSLLGILRHSSSVATKAARCKLAAKDKLLLFFGIRCIHPAIAPMIDRSAYIGGCDGVSDILGASMMGIKPVGTMPHAMIIAFGEQAKAWKAFDETMPPEVPRIALCDTWFDERVEALLAAETLGEKLYGVRLDTPGSRRGNMRKIAIETRWALDISGFKNVKIFVSGGLDEDEISKLVDVVDGFGVGTAIAFPPSIDIALDIVEVDGKPRSKKGKLPGKKQVYRCESFHDTVTPFEKVLDTCPRCGKPVEPLIKPLILNGKLVRDIPSVESIRRKVLEQLSKISMLELEPEPIFIS